MLQLRHDNVNLHASCSDTGIAVPEPARMAPLTHQAASRLSRGHDPKLLRC